MKSSNMDSGINNTESFRLLLEGTSECVLISDLKGTIIAANERFLKKFGYQQDEVTKMTVEDFVPQSMREKHVGLRETYTSSGKARPMVDVVDLAAVTKDKTEIPVEISLNYIDTDQHRLVIAFIVDISLKKERESALIQAGKFAAIGELAGNIAHEVNNPIGIISAKAKLLKKTEATVLSPKGITDLGKIVEQCDRIAKLTNGLLNFSRPSVGEKRVISIHDPLRQAVSLVGDRTMRHKIEVVDRMFAAPALVMGNANELQQVFLNLLLNAIDSISSGGQIVIETCNIEGNNPDGAKVGFRIQDNGQGMTEEQKHQVFDPFFTTKEIGGTGLGLSICMGLIRSHNGVISVESMPGDGAVFSFSLPAVAKT